MDLDEDSLRIAVLSDHLDEVDYYALLEVAHDAGVDAVRDAFHRFALRFHPDQHTDDPARQQKALAIFKRGAEAYRVLMHPALRARYDATRAQGSTRLEADAMQLPADGVERPTMPAGAQPFYDKALQAFARGEFGLAKMHLALASARGASPLFARLTEQIRECEQAATKG